MQPISRMALSILLSNLSVSSVGSSGMQLDADYQLLQVKRLFQYPRSDRAGCNPGGGRAPGESRAPFSILGRIERDATPPGGMPYCEPYIFQYPRSDRAGCNVFEDEESALNYALSVSSVGSSGMQPAGAEVIARAREAFQYPRSDRAGCNSRMRSRRLSVASLSVSSVGSSGMQRFDVEYKFAGDEAFSILGRIERDATCRRTHRPRRHRSTFSILGRIERDATTRALARAYRLLFLSVSSVGSSGMQLLSEFRFQATWTTFSILGRIERDATDKAPLVPEMLVRTFSILGRIERDATCSRECAQKAFAIAFQYPRSDRAGCNRLTNRSCRVVP